MGSLGYDVAFTVKYGPAKIYSIILMDAGNMSTAVTNSGPNTEEAVSTAVAV